MRVRDYQPGEQVPGTVYRVLRLIGSGGMGTVYDVEDTTIGKRYVLKTLHPKFGAREDLARRMQNEARTLARLHHPNIVEVITAGVTTDDLRLPYYLMERLSGQSLRVVLEKKGQLELSHAYHIGIDLLDALDHAHDKGVIHRDVKPDNIFLHRTLVGVTVTKLLDFGIVSMLDASHVETAGRFLGTLRYAAPEQLRGEKPTPKTDIYSAALVLYEIIAGRGPFDHEGDSHRIAAAHLQKQPVPVSHFAQVPRELDALLQEALAKNPQGRPRDAFSFAATLRNLKRSVEEARPSESTGNRVTAGAVLSPDSTTGLLAGEVAASISPPANTRSVPLFASSPSAVETAMPKATLVGMPALPADASPSLAATAAPHTLTTQDGGPALTPTGSIVFDTVPTPQNGTEPFLQAPMLGPSGDARGVADTEIQWPNERLASRSDEPQVHSLPAPMVRRPIRPMAFGMVGVLAVAVCAWIVVSAVRGASTAQVDARALAAQPASAPPAPVVVIAAPTIAPPQLDIQTRTPSYLESHFSKPTVESAASAPPASPRPKSAASPATRSPKPVAAPTASFATDRPGPGF